MTNAASGFWRDGRQFPSPAQWNAALSDFAELLSRDLSLDEIALRMAVYRGTAAVLLHTLCEKMGEQAR